MKKPICACASSDADISRATGYLKVIADPSRLKILCFLREGEKCVCDIWQYLEIPQNLTSHHLKVLKRLDLVVTRKDGQKVLYSLNAKSIRSYSRLVNKYLDVDGGYHAHRGARFRMQELQNPSRAHGEGRRGRPSRKVCSSNCNLEE